MSNFSLKGGGEALQLFCETDFQRYLNILINYYFTNLSSTTRQTL